MFSQPASTQSIQPHLRAGAIRPEGLWDQPGPFDLSASALDPRRKLLLAARTRTIKRQSVAV